MCRLLCLLAISASSIVRVVCTETGVSNCPRGREAAFEITGEHVNADAHPLTEPADGYSPRASTLTSFHWGGGTETNPDKNGLSRSATQYRARRGNHRIENVSGRGPPRLLRLGAPVHEDQSTKETLTHVWSYPDTVLHKRALLN